jgi:methyl coenzyme M reductase alpha subunit
MPYFVYRVFPFRRLEKVDELPTYGAAAVKAKALRVDPALPADCAVKLIFAADEMHAEELLSQVREKAPGLAGDE